MTDRTLADVVAANRGLAYITPTERFTYEDYDEQWDLLAGLLSRDAVAGGSLDAWIEEQAGRRGTDEVDRAFLREIDAWGRTARPRLAITTTRGPNAASPEESRDEALSHISGYLDSESR